MIYLQLKKKNILKKYGLNSFRVNISQKSETRMTTIVLKQDPNTEKVENKKRLLCFVLIRFFGTFLYVWIYVTINNALVISIHMSYYL